MTEESDDSSSEYLFPKTSSKSLVFPRTDAPWPCASEYLVPDSFTLFLPPTSSSSLMDHSDAVEVSEEDLDFVRDSHSVDAVDSDSFVDVGGAVVSDSDLVVRAVVAKAAFAVSVADVVHATTAAVVPRNNSNITQIFPEQRENIEI